MTQHTSLDPILAPLNPEQREAVTHMGGPLLVIAGPGSGKTRIIVRRAAWFVLAREIPPEHILAVTFTNRAAEEMRARLHTLLGEQSDAMWIYTFHAAALRLLRRFGDAIDLPPDFAVADEDIQFATLRQALHRMGLSEEIHPLHRVADYIGRCKANLLDPTLPVRGESVPPVWLELARLYQEMLNEQHLLDFDDLIVRAVHLLRARPDVQDHVRHLLTHILVDEYQDINLAQFTFLTLLAPPDREVTAVADADQSIYGWRGANPFLVDRFKRHYRPHIVKLTRSYRSTRHILYTAQRFIARKRLREEQSFLQTVRDQGLPIIHYIFQTLEQEQHWLAYVIRKLVTEQGYAHKDIAILYRVHTLGDPIEQHLLQEGIPVQRIKPRDVFEHDTSRDLVRYLALLHIPTEYDYVQALHFPTALLDEPTRAYIEQVARAAGVTLGHVAAHVEHFPTLGPLTRYRLKRFRNALADLRTAAPTLTLPALVNRLFDVLERRRSPFTREEHSLLRGFQLSIRFDDLVDALARAIDEGRAIHITLAEEARRSLDAWTARHILLLTLHEAIGANVRTTPPEEPTAFHIVVGTKPLSSSRGPDAASSGVYHIGPHDVGGFTYPLSVVAWRVATDLLVALEPAGRDTYVVYDLETTGTDPRRDDILEIAAQRYRGETPVGAPFYTLVHPERKRFIPKAASRVHGITWDDVADAPSLAEVLPRFLAYVGDDTLVGHNVRQFDHRFLDRALGEHLNRGLTNVTVDTLEMARRLFPDERRHTLEQVARFLGVPAIQSHRAGEDVELTARVYHRLLVESRAHRAREALPQALPLVALGLLDTSAPQVDELAALLHGARRVLHRFPHQPWVDHLVATMDEDLQWQAITHMARLRDMPLPPDPDDATWEMWRTRFLDHVERYLRSGGSPTLEGFLDYEALRTAVDEYDPEQDTVTLMTLHNAKGTEFPVVFIIGLEEGNLPLWTTRDDELARNEERRVFYVGMTRARDRLYLSSVLDRKDGFKRTVSPFVFELDEQGVRRYQVDRRGRVHSLDASAADH